MKKQNCSLFSIFSTACFIVGLGCHDGVASKEVPYFDSSENSGHPAACCNLFKNPVGFQGEEVTHYDITVVKQNPSHRDVKTVRDVPLDQSKEISTYLFRDISGSFDKSFEVILREMHSLAIQEGADESSLESCAPSKPSGND